MQDQDRDNKPFILLISQEKVTRVLTPDESRTPPNYNYLYSLLIRSILVTILELILLLILVCPIWALVNKVMSVCLSVIQRTCQSQ